MLFEMGGGKRGGLCLLKESSVLIAGLAVMGRFRGEAGHCAAAFQCQGCASGPCASSYNFGFCEYSNFTIS